MKDREDVEGTGCPWLRCSTANMAIIHRLSDLRAVGESDSAARNTALGLLADCSTRVIYAQESGEPPKPARQSALSETEIAQLPQLERGEGLWRVGERAFNRPQPSGGL